MQITRTLIAAALGTTALASLAAAAPAKTVQVGGCLTGLTNFESISSALASVPSGYTIDVCPGTYPEQLSISHNITITGVDTGGKKGSGSSQARLVMPQRGFAVNAADLDGGQPTVAQIVVTGGDSVTINNLTVDGSGADFSQSGCATDFVGILYQNASGTISNNAVLNTNLNDANLFGCQDGLAIYTQANGGTSATTISGNYVDGFQKNAITVNDTGASSTITNNVALGVGPTAVIAQNSIQVGFGATGTINGNDVGDDVYTPGPDSAGVLVYDATPITTTNNVVTNAQYAIAVVADTAGEADKPTVTYNQILTSFDAIDICGSAGGTVDNNLADGSANSAVHVDASCGVTTNLAAASNNRVNQACAGILEGSGTDVTSLTNTVFLSAAYDVLTGTDTCTADDASRSRRTQFAPFRSGPRRH